MVKCFATGCENSYAKGYTLVGFPKDEALREQWLTAICGRNIPTHNKRLCEVHFEDDSWEKKPRLKPGSIPSRFCNCRNYSTLAVVQTPDEETSSAQAVQDHSYCGSTSTAHCASRKRTPLSALNTLVSDHVYSSATRDQFEHQPECPVFMGKPSSPPIGQKLSKSDSTIFIKPKPKKRQEPVKSSSLSPVASPSKKMSRKEKMLTEEHRKLQAELDALRQQNDASVKMATTLRRKIEEQEQFWHGKFGSDQVACAVTGNSKGRKWETDTILKGLHMRYTGGTAGLKTASNMCMPLPGVRTLQRRTKNILFSPGVLYEILESFKEVLADYEEDDLDCVLIFDEMSIKSKANLWDPGTNAYMGGCTLPGVKAVATKALVFEFAGTRKRWKTTAAYHFVPNKGCNDEVVKVILELLKVAKDLGLNVVGLVCDMGNRGLLSSLGFSTKKDCMKNWIIHPLDPYKVIYCFPDAVHVFKSHKEVFMTNEDIQLSQDIVEKFGLPSRVVQFSHIRMLATYQDSMDVKFAPKLNLRDLESNHFSKMKVQSATKVINDKTAQGLNFLVYNEEAPVQCATTAWYINFMNRWFKLVTSRGRQLALSKQKPEQYQKALADLQLVIDVMNGMTFGGDWKVVQTHVIITTASMLAIQEELLAKPGYKFLCLGRFLQDAVENLFSVVRYRRPIPTALEFKYRLKQIVLGQLSIEITSSSYAQDDREEAVGLRKLLDSQKKLLPQCNVYLPIWEEPNAVDQTSATENVLYRMCGYAIQSLQKKNMLKCQTCLSALLHTGSSHHPLSTFTIMTNFSEGAQTEVNDVVFQLLRRVEFNLQKWKSFLPTIGNCMSDIVLDRVNLHTSDVVISECHPITEKVVSKFVMMRLKQFSMEFSPGLGLVGSSLSSKTMGGRYLAEQFNPTKTNKSTVKNKLRVVPKLTGRRLLL